MIMLAITTNKETGSVVMEQEKECTTRIREKCHRYVMIV